MKEILELAIKFNAKISVQYIDYEENEWTIPHQITHTDVIRMTEDNSVSKIQLDFPDCAVLINTKQF